MSDDSVHDNTSSVSERRSNAKALWYLLLIIPFIATLWVPFYAGKDPGLGGNTVLLLVPVPLDHHHLVAHCPGLFRHEMIGSSTAQAHAHHA